MTDPKEQAWEKAQKLAADIFNVSLSHITDAPKHCDDGWGGCKRNTNHCEIVAAVPIIAAALLEARREALEQSG